MQNENQFVSIAGIIKVIIWFILGFVALILLLPRIDSYLRLKAVDDCAKISHFKKQIPEEQTEVYYPLEDAYQKCLKDKGY